MEVWCGSWNEEIRHGREGKGGREGERGGTMLGN